MHVPGVAHVVLFTEGRCVSAHDRLRPLDQATNHQGLRAQLFRGIGPALVLNRVRGSSLCTLICTARVGERAAVARVGVRDGLFLAHVKFTDRELLVEALQIGVARAQNLV